MLLCATYPDLDFTGDQGDCKFQLALVACYSLIWTIYETSYELRFLLADSGQYKYMAFPWRSYSPSPTFYFCLHTDRSVTPFVFNATKTFSSFQSITNKCKPHLKKKSRTILRIPIQNASIHPVECITMIER